MRRTILPAAFLVLVSVLPLRAQTTRPAARLANRAATTNPFARWEKDVAAFEAKDRANPPPRGAVLFVGSSTIVRWKSLPADYPDIVTLNRGFGGNSIIDCTHFADRTIFPYDPKMIVLRAGGNDLHGGKTVEQVFGDYKDFVAKVRSKYPDVPIVYLSMSPAPARWAERDLNKQVNTLIEKYDKDKPNLKYVECYDMTLDKDGQPREELFVEDHLHFNGEGYKLLSERLRPVLAALPKEWK
jgi:lysophospholipase L1-like esterase